MLILLKGTKMKKQMLMIMMAVVGLPIGAGTAEAGGGRIPTFEYAMTFDFVKPTAASTEIAAKYGLVFSKATFEAEFPICLKLIADATMEEKARMFPTVRRLIGTYALCNQIDSLIEDGYYLIIFLGMTEEQIIARRGIPIRINRDTGSRGVLKQYVYKSFPSGYAYYYFHNGVLSSWTD